MRLTRRTFIRTQLNEVLVVRKKKYLRFLRQLGKLPNECFRSPIVKCNQQIVQN